MFLVYNLVPRPKGQNFEGGNHVQGDLGQSKSVKVYNIHEIFSVMVHHCNVPLLDPIRELVGVF